MTRASITPEFAAGLPDTELDQTILAVIARAQQVNPSGQEYSALLENLTILSNEREKRIAAKPRTAGVLPQLLVDWHAAGLLASPYRPTDVGDIPPLSLTAQQSAGLGPAPLSPPGWPFETLTPEPGVPPVRPAAAYCAP